MKITSKWYSFKLPIKKARGMENLVKDLQAIDPTYTLEKFIEDAIDFKARKMKEFLDLNQIQTRRENNEN